MSTKENLYEAEFDKAQEVSRGHGRVEGRTLVCTFDLPRRFTAFAGVRQIFRLERRVVHIVHKKSGKPSREIVYGMTSLPRLGTDAKELLALVRGHCIHACVNGTIENRVHYVRDVTMGEDASQARVGNIPQVMAAFRNAALAVVRKEAHTNIAAARRYLAANPKQALKLIGCQITE